ncbi:MAG: dihydroorotate dehydrogenase [Desulfatiglandales bacterium]
MDLTTEIGGLRLKNPVLVASGTYGYGLDYRDFYDPGLLGGIIVKGLSLEPQEGNPPPRIVETPCGMLNSIGLANMGVKEFVKVQLPLLREIDTHIIANIYGKTMEEYQEVAQILGDQEGISALEVNISCPNVKRGGLLFGAEPISAYEVISSVRRVYKKTLIAKLTPNVTDISPIIKAVEEGGAEAISLINTLRGMAVDIYTKRPKLGNGFGGLSGPAIKPVALYFVYSAVRSTTLPVIGIGGIVNAEDAIEFFLVGAKAVQVGTANFVNPKAPIEIIEGIRAYLEYHQMGDIKELINSLKEC